MHIAHVTSFYDAPALSPSSAVRMRGSSYLAAGHEFSVIVPGKESSIVWADYGTVVTVPARGAALRRGFVPITHAIQSALERLLVDRVEVADRLSYRRLGGWAHTANVGSILLADESHVDPFDEVATRGYDRVVSSLVTADHERRDAQLHSGHDGVDVERFSPLRHNQALRRTSGAELIVACATPFTSLGGAALALDTLGALAAAGVDVHFVLIGDGPLKGRLERLAQGLPVQFLSAQNVTLDERAEVFATSDVALITSQDKSAKLIALEALACGTPTVIADGARLGLSFAEGAGLTTAPVASQLAHAVRILAKEPVERRRVAARRTSLDYDALPLNRAMLELHLSID